MKIREIEYDFDLRFADRLIQKRGTSYKECLVGMNRGSIVNSRNLAPNELDEVLDLNVEVDRNRTPRPGNIMNIVSPDKFPYRSPPRYYPAHNYHTGKPLGKPDVDRERGR